MNMIVRRVTRALFRKPVGIALMSLLFSGALVLFLLSAVRIFAPVGECVPLGETILTRVGTAGEEGYTEEENSVCEVEFVSAEGDSLFLTYSFAEWETLADGATVTGYLFSAPDGTRVLSLLPSPEPYDLNRAVRAERLSDETALLDVGLALALAAIGFGIISFTGRFFSRYEKVWFVSILVLAAVFAILFPEEDCNGVNGIAIMALYLADTLLNILCELLISKQSKWNFLVSVFVELTEIAICVILAYRFATMLTTLFFWLPIDIVSFVNWHRHPDRQESDVTEVRRLRGWQKCLVLLGVAVWTLGVGYLLTRIDLGTDLFGGNETLEAVVCYLDACASILGIANGLFIFFRFEEQWIAWILVALLEAAINILSGQFVLLVLKAGYLTNSVYGYVRWNLYIRNHPEVGEKHSVF